MIPGEMRVRDTPIVLNEGREKRTVVVVNDGDRPIQVGSHLHLRDANPALSFDRDSVVGFRLDIPAGTSVRFEPGVSRSVEVVALGGRQFVAGLQIRSAEETRPQNVREPKTVVPFGTPGTKPENPGHALRAPAKVSDTPPQDEPDSGQQQRGEK